MTDPDDQVAYQLGAWSGPYDPRPDPRRRCQCGHKRKHHGVETEGLSSPWCMKCEERAIENAFHSFTETVVPAVMAETPVERALPQAVVFAGPEVGPVEMFIPPGFAVMLTEGGILVAHEDYEVLRIISVRPLRPGEADAVQDHAEQGQDQAGVDGA